MSATSRDGADADLLRLMRQWQTTFDALGVTWEAIPPWRVRGLGIEPPALWLPRSQQLLAIREAISPWDATELLRLHNTLPPRVTRVNRDLDIRVIVALPGGYLLACNDTDWTPPVMPDCSVTRNDKSWMRPALYECGFCHAWWFLDEGSSWRCQSCLHYDGNVTVARHFDGGQVTPWPTTPPTASSTTRCPPREWLGVRRA
jgi:hypothetical protein